MAGYQDTGALTDLEFAEFADSFLGYQEHQTTRPIQYLADVRMPPQAYSGPQWAPSPAAHQPCVSAGGSDAILPAATGHNTVAPLSPSDGSSQDSLANIDSESSGRRREVHSSSGRAKRNASTAVRRSGAISKSRASDRAAVSHSTVEKQRRDRINALIDELRDLVPVITPWPKSDQQSDQKRPKHLVLSDTITLLKQLQEQVKAKDAQVKELSACMTAVKSEQPRTFPTSTSPDGTTDPFNNLLDTDYQLPVPSVPEAQLHMQLSPPQQPTQVVCNGIVIEEGLGGCMYLKLNCMDRPGLLSDIMVALRSLPLDVRRASITTHATGQVHDVFELVPLDPLLTAQDVRLQVQCVMGGCQQQQQQQQQCSSVPQGSSCLPLEDGLPWDLLA